MPGSNKEYTLGEILDDLLQGYTLYDQYVPNYHEDLQLMDTAKKKWGSARMKFRFCSEVKTWPRGNEWEMLVQDTSNIDYSRSLFLLGLVLSHIQLKDIVTVTKKELFSALKRSHNSFDLLKRCVSPDETDPLRQRFWQKNKNGVLCAIDNGTRKEICDYLKIYHRFNAEAEYYNQCLERLAHNILHNPKQASWAKDFSQTLKHFIKAVEGSEIKAEYQHESLTNLLNAFNNQAPLDQETLLQAIFLLPKEAQIPLLKDCIDPDSKSCLSRNMRAGKPHIGKKIREKLETFINLSSQLEEKTEIYSSLQKMPEYDSAKMTEILGLMVDGFALNDRYQSTKAEEFWDTAFKNLEICYTARSVSASNQTEKSRWAKLAHDVSQAHPDRDIMLYSRPKYPGALVVLEMMLTNLTQNDVMKNGQTIKIDKDALFSAIKKLPNAEQITLLKQCLTSNCPLHQLFWEGTYSGIDTGIRKKMCQHLRELEPGFSPEAEYYNQCLENGARKLKLMLDSANQEKNALTLSSYYKTFNSGLKNFLNAVTLSEKHGCNKTAEAYTHVHLTECLPSIVKDPCVKHLDPKILFLMIQLLPEDIQINLLRQCIGTVPATSEYYHLSQHFHNAKDSKKIFEKINQHLSTLRGGRLDQSEEKRASDNAGTRDGETARNAVRFKFAAEKSSKIPPNLRRKPSVEEFELEPLGREENSEEKTLKR